MSRTHRRRMIPPRHGVPYPLRRLPSASKVPLDLDVRQADSLQSPSARFGRSRGLLQRRLPRCLGQTL